MEASGSPATGADLWDTISADARRESKLWNSALRSPEKQDRRQIFSRLGEERYALGIETIYEGYLLHYGQPRLFAPEDDDTARGAGPRNQYRQSIDRGRRSGSF